MQIRLNSIEPCAIETLSPRHIKESSGDGIMNCCHCGNEIDENSGKCKVCRRISCD